jgi:hypothetical protein
MTSHPRIFFCHRCWEPEIQLTGAYLQNIVNILMYCAIYCLQNTLRYCEMIAWTVINFYYKWLILISMMQQPTSGVVTYSQERDISTQHNSNTHTGTRNLFWKPKYKDDGRHQISQRWIRSTRSPHAKYCDVHAAGQQSTVQVFVYNPCWATDMTQQ